MIAKLYKGVFRRLLSFVRTLKYQSLSLNSWTGHKPQMYQPVLLSGSGEIKFETNVRIGVSSSPRFWSSECYIEARSASAKIEICQNTWINNNFSVISKSGLITIGRDCLIGHDVFIIDSDFHSIDPDLRFGTDGATSEPIYIGNNVFIGSRVIILKNTVIGDGCVVAAGAVVSGTFSSRSLIAGNPAKLVKRL